MGICQADFRYAFEQRHALANPNHFEPAMPSRNLAQRTCQPNKLVNNKMLVPSAEDPRQYAIGFVPATLLRSCTPSPGGRDSFRTR
jgi:hypothetical protein